MDPLDWALREIPRHNVYFFVHEGAVDETQVHHAGRRGKMQAVELAPAAKAVGSLQELEAKAGAHFWSERDDIASVVQLEAPRVVPAYDHGKCILETEGLGDFEIEALGVTLLHSIVDVMCVAARRFV